MEVRTCREACAATKSDGVTGTHHLIFPHKLLRKMTIGCLQSVAMANNNILAISPISALVLYHTNLTAEGGTNGIANIHFDVGAIVIAAKLTTISKMRIYHTAFARHVEVTQVYAIFCRQCLIVVYKFVSPGLIEVTRGILH